MSKESGPTGDPHFPNQKDLLEHLFDQHGYSPRGESVWNAGLRERGQHDLDTDPVKFHRESHDPKNAKLFGPARPHRHKS